MTGKCSECGRHLNSFYYTFVNRKCCQDSMNLQKDKRDNIIWGTHDYFDNKNTGKNVK